MPNCAGFLCHSIKPNFQLDVCLEFVLRQKKTKHQFVVIIMFFRMPFLLVKPLIFAGNSLRLSMPDRLVDRSSFGGQKTTKDTRFHNAYVFCLFIFTDRVFALYCLPLK